MIIIEKSLKLDLEEVKKLLLENNLPIDDIEESAVQFFIAKVDNSIVGVIGIEQYKGIGLLRSLAVQDRYKNMEIGRNLIEYLLDYSENNAIRELFLLTTSAEKYFKKFDFYKIHRENTPTTIKETKEFSDICPAAAVIMKKGIEKLNTL